MLKKALFVGLVVLPGCLDNVAVLEPKAESVKVVRETDKPLRCDVLGKISGTSRSDDEKAARKGAENDFRNHAAELKANFAGVADMQDLGLVQHLRKLTVTSQKERVLEIGLEELTTAWRGTLDW